MTLPCVCQNWRETHEADLSTRSYHTTITQKRYLSQLVYMCSDLTFSYILQLYSLKKQVRKKKLAIKVISTTCKVSSDFNLGRGKSGESACKQSMILRTSYMHLACLETKPSTCGAIAMTVSSLPIAADSRQKSRIHLHHVFYSLAVLQHPSLNTRCQHLRAH